MSRVQSNRPPRGLGVNELRWLGLVDQTDRVLCRLRPASQSDDGVPDEAAWRIPCGHLWVDAQTIALKVPTLLAATATTEPIRRFRKDHRQERRTRLHRSANWGAMKVLADTK
jgi:hypothetical protein